MSYWIEATDKDWDAVFNLPWHERKTKKGRERNPSSEQILSELRRMRENQARGEFRSTLCRGPINYFFDKHGGHYRILYRQLMTLSS